MRTGLAYRDSMYELQRAVYARLEKQFVDENGKPVAVYDQTPRDEKGQLQAKYPFINIGDSETMTDWSTKTNSGQAITAMIEIWSQYGGFKEAGRLASEISLKLTEQPLTLQAGFRVVQHQRIGSVALRDPDGRTVHWVLRFRFLIEDTSTFQTTN